MTRPRMRPTFVETTAIAPETILERMRKRLERSDCPVSGLVGRRHVELTTCVARRHLWSPMLVVEMDEDARGEHRLRGRFAPHPNVWTGFMAIYGLLFMGGLGATMFGVSQWKLGWTPWALLGVPLALVLAALTYGAAFIGQGLGSEEMYELRSFVDRCIDDVPERASERPPEEGGERLGKVTRTGAVRYE